ncbi:hypothetical protein Rhe02_80650 [Rhizocola hellebori]|uniref:Serine hydrolase n=1 Tax=Rhizocola hellebori TaxID=1392758 RepID=A0A8J3QIG0_9ACTN|nr:hypothetical protein [Rhizocola hellebori]GIH09998.1 hypothetical protein Rhe02_80650 [Rhizocola hellebori]
MWISWAFFDRRDGTLRAAENAGEPTMTASMVKAWLVADYLASHGWDERLSTIIRDSANEPAWEIYALLGREKSIERMISVCGLTDSAPGEDLSMTLMSARDTVRLGRCLADGTAAGPRWTSWLLDEMRAVRGTGDFGIREAFAGPDRERIAIKNGWDKRQALGEWNVNCLAVAPAWIMAALTRYPSSLPLAHGAQICRNLVSELV